MNPKIVYLVVYTSSLIEIINKNNVIFTYHDFWVSKIQESSNGKQEWETGIGILWISFLFENKVFV